ncbi:precorrin-6A/cobalt-precorrin-6A reductase [Marinagarivorans algicola]|uniref:precorrin-6A/cobalt-precorrin-6A reductase n=1 Tax=Marinagarivorans algicola TaxID=1513270 RepID=UPI0037363335
MRLLILGGTADGRKLAARLHARGITVIYSVAGLVRMPKIDCQIISGGFTRFGGLPTFIQRNSISAILDVTHPYAATMSAKAVNAAAQCLIPCWRFHRPAWRQSTDDRWQLFNTWESLATALSGYRSVFLTCGQINQQQINDLAANTQQQIVLRTAVQPKYHLPPNIRWIKAIGPFTLEGEREVMHKYHIDVVVSKNSGGNSTVAKLFVARELNIPVFMLTRPKLPAVVHQFSTQDDCLIHVLSVFSS